MKIRKVLSVRKIKPIKTSDITVDSKDHVFYANNVVVSNSHAMSYAMNSYLSAYLKTHFPTSFFTSYLYYAKDKQGTFNEVKLLVNNARKMGINILPPCFKNDNTHFKRIGKKQIFFGFSNIKGIGDSAVKKMNSAIFSVESSINKKKEDWSWLEFLVFLSPNISKTTVNGLIEAGALSYMGISRTRMLFEYEQFNKLTNKEIAWICQNFYTNEIKNITDMLNIGIKEGSGKGKMTANKNRLIKAQSIVDLIDNPPYSLVDTPEWIARVEEAKLGLPLTYSMVDSCLNLEQANCTVVEFLQRKNGSSGIFIACHIDSCNTFFPRNKTNEMASIMVSDITGDMKCVIFSDVWAEVKPQGTCFEGNTVLITGDRSRDGESFIIKKMWQLT